MTPLFSIILPAYNCEAFLSQGMESVLRQLPEDGELIVVDDGSMDGTARILKQYEGSRENLRIEYAAHSGASGARNRGLSLARGEYVAFLDCDDCLQDDFLEKSRPLLDEKAGLYIFGIERVRIDGNSEFWTVRDRIYDSVSDFADEYIRTRQLLIYSNCNKFYRRSLLEEAGLRFEEGLSFGEDRLFNYRYLELLDRQEQRAAVITSSMLMLRYIERDRLSQSTKYVPQYFRQAMRLHEEKMRCFLALSRGTSKEERLDFEAYDLSRETETAIERFQVHPEEREENLPEINRMVFGGPYEHRAKPDILVILGSGNCGYKADAAAEIGRKDPALRYIVSGANMHRDGDCTEEEFLYRRLREHGVPASMIYRENRARYTRQNLEFSAGIIRELQNSGLLPSEAEGAGTAKEKRKPVVGIVTAGFHIPRASCMAGNMPALEGLELSWYPAFGATIRPEIWFEHPVSRSIVLEELRKTLKERRSA